MNKSSQSISTSGQSLNVHQSHSKQQMQIEQWLQAHGIETALDKDITEIYLPKSEIAYLPKISID